jgi:PEGA domain
MRTALVAVLLVGLSATVAAQSRTDRPKRSTDEPARPSIGLPLPQIGLPLPPIGLPLPSMGLPPRTLVRPEPLQRPERSERFERFDRRRGSAILFVPAFGWPYPYLPGTAAPSAPSPSLPPVPPPSATGRVHLDLQSGIDPQIYVDGYYVGLLSDASGELTLDAGTHTIELREDGFETLRVDVQVPVDGLITYRGELKRPSSTDVRPSGAPPDLTGPRSEVPPTTIYVIPGCYVGNVPPADAALPAGCNADRAVAFPSRR